MEPKQESIARLVKQMEKVFEKIKKLSPGKEDATRIASMLEEFGRKLKK